MTARRAIIGIGIFAMAIFVLLVVLAFVKLNTTVSDFSSSDAPFINQYYYNFFHGRMAQISIYTEFFSQFINPHPYLNFWVFHFNILAGAIVGLFYIFLPGINTMYAVILAINYIGFAFFTYKIMERLSPSHAYLKSLLAFSVFVLNGYLRQVLLSGMPITLCGPFILAAYYFLISGKRVPFFLTVVSLCLITEELAVFMLTFLTVMWFFEKRSRKVIYLSMAFAAAYFILWNFILQPALRYDLIPVTGNAQSMLLMRFRYMAGGGLSFLLSIPPKTALIVFSGFYLTILAAIAVYRFFGFSRPPEWTRIFYFIFLAPIAFWAYGIYSLSGRHLFPIMAMTYIAFLLLLSAVNFNWKKRLSLFSSVIAVFVSGIFLAVNVLVMAPALPFSLRSAIWNIVKRHTGAEIFNRNELQGQIATNKETIKVIRTIPKDKSITFWGNYTLSAFITDRNDIWFFPLYYDRADFLVIQKDAKCSYFGAEGMEDLNYNKPGIQDKFYEGKYWTVSKKVVDRIKEELVDKEHAYRIFYDSSHVIILERLVKYKFEMPDNSMGFGWMENMPKVFGIADRNKK